MSIVIIKYNAGNVYSVQCALARIGADAIITDNADIIRNADKVIFPGVGEAGAAMHHLRQTGLDKIITSLQKPTLGICIGQQLMCSHSEEGNTECLGIFPDKVIRFQQPDNTFKIPHTGWNTVQITAEKGIIPQEMNDAWVYYVHSYYVPVGSHTTAVTNYISPFSAAMRRNNFYATQFHPEKSGDAGSRILKHFLDL